ncbi:MAG: hypothetical protein GQ574_27450 [Crocinitomix sp.]|nr:hypothetical protein [Crocinitomix sp.]
MELNYQDISFVKAKEHLTKNAILLVTATDLETIALHKKLLPIDRSGQILKTNTDEITLYLAVLGKYKVVHVQCGKMGSISRQSSIVTVRKALENTKSIVVMMVGIAFGVNPLKQNIGDVLVSESIIPYNSKRVGTDENGDVLETIRGIESPASDLLLNRLKNIRNWEHNLKNGKKAKVIPTRLLSGEELVDNLKYRNKLIAICPESKGGEMEGAGVYAACGNKLDWVLIKGICDFGDGDKGTKKQLRQTDAIESALSLTLGILNSENAFHELGISIYANVNESFDVYNSDVINVLFNLYDKEKKDYYVVRTDDRKFNSSVKEKSLWLWGASGSGKSNIIVRNIIESNLRVVNVNLSSCVGLTVKDLFTEIYSELYFDVHKSQLEVIPSDFKSCSKLIIELLSNNLKSEKLIVFIEEIPISGDESNEEFTKKFISLLISKTYNSGLSQVKFILSSIENPVRHISDFQTKIYESMKFVKIDFWEESYILELINKIETKFEWNLHVEDKAKLIKMANGSPRFIKKFYHSLYTLKRHDRVTVERILSETDRELA